jgi:hypothetical protein
LAIETDRDGHQDAPERHDAMAQVAWTKGYLYGVGKAKLARVLARKRSSENIEYRRAAHDIARALDRNRRQIMERIR